MSNIVTIVGRPNVGKSTLFNRLTQQRTAIVDDTPGITRDRHYEVAEWGGHRFTIIDTGGYRQGSDDGMTEQINEQVAIAMEEGDVVLFVVDCKAGLMAEDVALAKQLRKAKKPVVVVANKSDNPTLSAQASVFHGLGLGDVHEVAAEHGTGTGDLLDVVVGYLQAGDAGQEEGEMAKVAFIGRTNTGKSTFVNALLGTNRSVVSDEHHTTRVPTHSHYRLYNKEVKLIDTAGIAKKNQISADSVAFYSLIRTIKAMEQSDVCVVFIDAQQGLTMQDKRILTLAHRKKKGIVLLVNKWDLVAKDSHTASSYKRELAEALGFMNYVPILLTSGLYKKNLYQTMEKALLVYANRGKRIATATLNKIIQQAIRQMPPPAVKHRQLKINYATQLAVPWPMFAIFCNFPKDIPTNYKRYLEKQFRLFSSFEGVPLTLSFRQKSNRGSRGR